MDRPEINLHEVFFVQAFWRLDSCRPYPGMMIPWTAQREYCQFYGLSHDNTESFFAAISAMDTAYLDDVAKRAKTKT